MHCTPCHSIKFILSSHCDFELSIVLKFKLKVDLKARLSLDFSTPSFNRFYQIVLIQSNCSKKIRFYLAKTFSATFLQFTYGKNRPPRRRQEWDNILFG